MKKALYILGMALCATLLAEAQQTERYLVFLRQDTIKSTIVYLSEDESKIVVDKNAFVTFKVYQDEEKVVTDPKTNQQVPEQVIKNPAYFNEKRKPIEQTNIIFIKQK